MSKGKKPTLVLGASHNPYRYAWQAIQQLKANRYDVYALGLKSGEIAGVNVQTSPDNIQTDELDTVTVYLNPANQTEYEDWIVSMNPKRVIFNPGSENPKFEKKLSDHGIDTIRACTLVMLATAQY